MESPHSTLQLPPSFEVPPASPPTLPCIFSEPGPEQSLLSTTTSASRPSPQSSPLLQLTSMFPTSSQLCLSSSSSLSSLLQCFPSPPLQPQPSSSLSAESTHFLSRQSLDSLSPSSTLPATSTCDFAQHQQSPVVSGVSKTTGLSGTSIENMFTCGICRKQYSTEKYLQMHFALHKDVAAAAATGDYTVDKKSRRQLKPGSHQSDYTTRSPFFFNQRRLPIFPDQKEKHYPGKPRHYDCQHFQATNPKFLQELQHTSQNLANNAEDISIRLPLSPYLDFNSFPLSANTSVFQRPTNELMQSDFPTTDYSLTCHQSPLAAIASDNVPFLDSSTTDVFQSVPSNTQPSSDVNDHNKSQSNQCIAASYYTDCPPLTRYSDRYKNIGQASKTDVSYQQQRQKVAASSSSQVWTCTYCSKTFTQSSNYKNHVRTHSDERPYVCELCSIGFKERYHLKKHLLFKHSTEAKEECRFCGKRFKDSTAVRAHERIHSDQRPYSCQRCRKAFKTSECLWHHENRSRTCGKALDNAKNEANASQNVKTTADNIRNSLNVLDKTLFPANVTKHNRKTNSGMRKSGENSKKKAHSQKVISSELRSGSAIKDFHHYTTPLPSERSLVKLERSPQNIPGYTPENRFQILNHHYYSTYLSKVEPLEICSSTNQACELAGTVSFFPDSTAPPNYMERFRKCKQFAKTDSELLSSTFGNERGESLTYAQLKPVRKSNSVFANTGHQKHCEKVTSLNHDHSAMAYYQSTTSTQGLTALEPLNCSSWPEMLIKSSNCKYGNLNGSNGSSNGRETCQFSKERQQKKKTYARENDLNGSNCPIDFGEAANRKAETTCGDVGLLTFLDPGPTPVPQLYYRDSPLTLRQQSQSVLHCQRQQGYSYYQGPAHIPYLGAIHGQQQPVQVAYVNRSPLDSSCYLQNHLQSQPNPSYTSLSHEQSLSQSQHSALSYNHQHQATNSFYMSHQHTQPLFHSQPHQHVLLPTAVVAPIKRLDETMAENDAPLNLEPVSQTRSQTLALDPEYYDNHPSTSSYQQIMDHGSVACSVESEKITYTQQRQSDDFVSKPRMAHDPEKQNSDHNDCFHQENQTPKTLVASPVTSCNQLDIKTLPPFETFVPVTRSSPDHIHHQQGLANSSTTDSLSDDQKPLQLLPSPQDSHQLQQPLSQHQQLQNHLSERQADLNNTFQCQQYYNCRYSN